MSKQWLGNDADPELNDFKVNVGFLIFNTSLLYYFIIHFFSATEFLSHQVPRYFAELPRFCSFS